MENLPKDILVEIIFRLLPPSSRVAFLFVYKRFYQLLVPNFVPPPMVSQMLPFQILAHTCEDQRQGKSLAVWLIEYLKYPVKGVDEMSALGAGIIFFIA